MLILLTLVLAGRRPRVNAEGGVEGARLHFRQGQQHYNLGEFGDALNDFREAYRLKDDPTLLFNMGQCQWKLGDDPAALHSYKAYLRLSHNPPNRAEVERRIAEIERRISQRPPNPARPFSTRQPQAELPAGSAVDLSVRASPQAPESVPSTHGRWWLWPAVGAVALAVGAGAFLLLGGHGASEPSTPLGNQKAFR